MKPSPGLVSTRGIVPACRSLDCASVFALTVDDGAAVLAAVAGPDARDPFSREVPLPPGVPPATGLAGLRVGVPLVRDVAADFDGDADAAAAFESAVRRLADAGAHLVPVDLTPFLEVAALLYDGPWIAERTAAIGDFVAARPEALHPVTRAVLAGAEHVRGVDVFRGLHALAEARRRTAGVWDGVDALMVPTAPTAPTIERMLADPLGANTVLGRYTNFVNLLDLAAIAVPSALTPGGLPVGVTFLAPSGGDSLLLGLGAAWQRAVDLPLGATGHRARPGEGLPLPAVPGPEEVLIAVVGAHLEGEPLNADLLRLGARLHARTHTAAAYRLYALPSQAGGLARPGLVRVPSGGASVEAEVYRMPVASLGRLVAGVPAPLGFGTVRLADGSGVLGFLCEQAGLDGAVDITAHGGWRAFLAAAP